MEERFLVKVSYYRHVFVSEFNLSFAHPKSDTCSTCDAGKSTEEHTLTYKLSFEMQSSDREKAKKVPNVCYMTVDLQQTMPLPKLSTSKAFYLRQLCFYNLGVHCVTTDGLKRYLLTWIESEANRGSVEVISCLWTLIQNTSLINTRRHLIIWSDSCPGQNKNFNMIALHQVLVLKNFDIIDHKFPEVGHTYLDSDRDFGRIEKVLRKHENIYTPEQYREIIKGAIGVNGTLINMSDHFRSVTSLPRQLKIKNAKTNVLKQKISFRDELKWIRVEEYGSYLYKTSYTPYTPFLKVKISDEDAPDISNVLQRKKMTKVIAEEKIKNLAHQIQFIPEEHKWFYKNIVSTSHSDVDASAAKKKK